ncbi:hypothetical protein RJ640_021261 [Escallonia rubra]|uniref:Epidermal patterning factor-like protein n=1 Tax=Escallonia rubra TaxID=112253 RepID=A0AA88R2X7_9ASTE|nr:hypothetical protein RJ640_021261 [Escallonia rubra]
MVMTLSRNYPLGLQVAVAVILIIFSLTVVPSKSVGTSPSFAESDVQQINKVLGSRPPGCVNKCMNCRPCVATLVIPPHQRKGFVASSRGGDDTTYYLLSWKCRCGNKLFQP